MSTSSETQISTQRCMLSIDVGIKHLALCLMSLTSGIIKIHKWDVINICEALVSNVCNEPSPSDKINCSSCSCVAKYKKENVYYCEKHSKTSKYYKPVGDLSVKKLHKNKLVELKSLIEKYTMVDIANKKRKTKQDYIDLCLSYLLEPLKGHDIPNVKANEVDLITIGRIMVDKLDYFLLGVGVDFMIDTVIIENQISPIANRMKSVQAMLTQYFIIKHPIVEVKYISASNKLKGKVDTESYSERKQKGIEICVKYINNDWKSFFSSHKKKDDLADCFLQGLWYFENANKNK